MLDEEVVSRRVDGEHVRRDRRIQSRRYAWSEVTTLRRERQQDCSVATARTFRERGRNRFASILGEARVLAYQHEICTILAKLCRLAAKARWPRKHRVYF